MIHYSPPKSHDILTRRELKLILSDLAERSATNVWWQQNLAIFRLAACCALRASEVSGLRLRDVRVHDVNPCVVVPDAIAKNKHGGKIPLCIDAGLLQDLREWKIRRGQDHATASDYFVCIRSQPDVGKILHRNRIRERFLRACKVLGAERVAEITTHTGRHTAISHWAHSGVPLVTVRDWARHSNIGITSNYLHAIIDDDQLPNAIFSYD